MKKFLSIVLALCMVLGCASALAESPASLQGYTSTWDNYGLSKEPITMTIGVGIQDVPNSEENNIALDLIYQATGIRVQFVGYDAEKFAVLTAGGDLPDLFSMEASNAVPELIDAGLLLDMAPYIDQYGANIKQVHSDYAIPMAENLYGDGEHLYFLPSNAAYLGDVSLPSERGAFGYNVRWDLYQAIGAPAITDENGFNEDLFLDVLAKMQAYAREKTGKDTIYALSGWNSWGTDWCALLPYSVSCTYYLNTFGNRVTGLVDIDPYGDSNSNYYGTLRFYNKAWRMGILDPELFTLTLEQYEAKVFNGDVLVSNNAWYTSQNMDPSVTEVFGDDCNFYEIKGMPFYFSLLTENSPGGYGMFAADAINANCKYPERAVALMDYLRSDEFMRTVSCGLQGIHWDYDETGKPVYIGAAAEAYANGTWGDFKAVGNGNYIGFPCHKLALGNKVCADGYFADFTTSAEYVAEKAANDKGVQDYLKFYNSDARYIGEAYKQWVDEGIAAVAAGFNPKLAFTPAASDEMNSLNSKCNSYFNENCAKAIFVDTVEESEAAIEKMISDLKAMGCETLYQSEVDRQTESQRIAAELGF